MNVCAQEYEVCIPSWVRDFKSFRRWTRSKDFPERGRYSHLRGDLWVDLSLEIELHNQIKSIIGMVLMTLARTTRLGKYFVDGMRLYHAVAGVSQEPDGMFAFWETLRSGRARLNEREQSLELEGTPDMALEVISKTSFHKDAKVLRELYWQAGIAEYWLVDARRDPVEFKLLRRTARGYAAVRPVESWVKSAVFGKEFRLVRGVDPIGEPEYTLEVRS